MDVLTSWPVRQSTATHQEITGLQLSWIQHVQQPPLPRRALQVFGIELPGHVTPNLSTLDTGNVTLTRQVQPIRFLQLGPNQKIEIINLVVLSN